MDRAAEGRVPGGWRLKHALRFARERRDRRTTWRLPRKYPQLLKVECDFGICFSSNIQSKQLPAFDYDRLPVV
jgi:hypothetical protein